MSDKSYLRRVREMLPRQRFVYYMNERYDIKIKRDEGVPRELWTADPILREYKFTNVKRAWDYTSRWLQESWYDPHGRKKWAGMIAAFARFFPYVPTLEAVGLPQDNPKFLLTTNIRRWFARSKKVLADRQDRKIKIFSSAYIIGGIGSARKSDYVIDHFLTPVLEEGVLLKSWDSALDLHERLKEFDGWGDFMTQEVVLDLMETFVLAGIPAEQRREYGFAGPGAIRGLNRIFGRSVDAHYHRNTARMEMKMLWGFLKDKDDLHKYLRQSLTVHDVEFNLCEFDKYNRALFGEGTPKQKFVPRSDNTQGDLL